ncbi:toprim domain-containing protein [Brucella pseudogrignonensis]|uniref:DUF7146 domain-containing protein n=1 Tax=Brucella pseudogrignonensis TaxID=419475 RepID=UPI001E50A291|nr:toprim domain-containing protein [Brucella pseudogrignonensis]MCD4512792.1 toprim domain-containing protein [Brucella pseudogrignonensis]
MIHAKKITRALGGHWYGRYGVARCPAHDDQHPSLSLSDGSDGRLLLRCHAGCGFRDIIDSLKGLGLAEGEGNYFPPSPVNLDRIRKVEQKEAARKERLGLECWNATSPIHGTIAETYLCHRGISCQLPDTLRFHPYCRHPSGNRYPAMVALVEGAQRLAVHRTYLRVDGHGKADIEPAKAMLGTVTSGAVRLSIGCDKLIVCEGIETGLSLLSGLVPGSVSVWAALSTNGMKALSLPHPTGALVVATDGDAAGREAGNVLAMRADAVGWCVSILAAPDGHDWNDILVRKGVIA